MTVDRVAYCYLAEATSDSMWPIGKLNVGLHEVHWQILGLRMQHVSDFVELYSMYAKCLQF